MATSYRTEVFLPIKQDPRTFEQRHNEKLNNLERTISSSSSETRTTTSATSSKPAEQASSASSMLNQIVSEHPNWNKEIEDFVNLKRKGLRRTRDSFLRSELDDTFGLRSKWMDEFNRFGAGGTDGLSSNFHEENTSVQENLDGSTQTRTTKSSFVSTSSSGGGTGALPAAAPKGGPKDLQMTTDAMKEMRMNDLQSFAPKTTSTDLLRDAYELGEDGQLHFILRFEMEDFGPDDIKVSVQDRTLTVKAHREQNVKDGNTTKTSTRSFSRSIDIPKSVDEANFKSNLTKDGILILDTVVKAPNYESITFKEGRFGVRGNSNSETAICGKEPLKILGKDGLQFVNDEQTKSKKVHIEVAVDPEYSSEDFHIYTEGDTIYINGKKEIVKANSTSTKNFARQYGVSSTLDPLGLNAKLIGNTLVVEAPFLK